MAYDSTQLPSLSVWEKLSVLVTIVFKLPTFITWKFITSPFTRAYKHKSWRRVLNDAGQRCGVHSTTTRQVQWLIGPSVPLYVKWMRKNKLEPVVEDIDEGARILWIGPKKADKVILYFHGGAFLLSLQEPSLPYFKYVRSELQNRGVEASIAILDYSLAPDAPFPVQLRQAVAAIKHLFDSGVKPSNLQMTGDSAGGLLIAQIISHTLHPLEGLPRVPELSAPFNAAYMMSPWVTYGSTGRTYEQNSDLDFLSAAQMGRMGKIISDPVKAADRAYAEPATAPSDWWAGVDKVFSRIMVSTGEKECLAGHDIAFADELAKHHKGMKPCVVQKDGVHIDPFMDFAAGIPPPERMGTLTPQILDWFESGFKGA